MGARSTRELWKRVVVASVGGLLFASPSAVHGAGELDTTFGVDGVIVSDLPHTGAANTLLQQTDGQLVAVGVVVGGGGAGPSAAWLERRDASGALDPTFGVGGRVVGSRTENVLAGSVDPNGRFVTFGGPFYFSDPPATITRYLADGSVDLTFGDSGRTSAFIGSASGIFVDGLVQPDTTVVAVAQRYYPDTATAVVRFLTDGTPDGAFGTGGVVSPPAGVSLGAIARQADGRLIAAGTLLGGATEPLVVIRLQADGALDSTFGTDGIAFVPLADGNDAVRKVIVLADGRIVVLGVGGPQTALSRTSVVLARLLADGTVDASFGGGGRSATPIGKGVEAKAIIDDPDGRLVVAGYAQFGGQFIEDVNVALVRYLADGSLDPDFGSGGIVATAVGSDSGARGLVRQADGKLVVAGFTTNATTRLFLARYYADGSPPTTTSTTTTYTLPTTTSSTLRTCTCANPCEACDADGQCRAPLDAGCAQARPRGSKLVLQRGSTPARDRLSWSWQSPSGSDVAGFGDPPHGHGFTLCVFERDSASGAARLVATVPGAAQCGDRPCWTTSRHGYRYADRAGSFGGVRKASIAATSTGEVKVAVRGAGNALALLPLDFAFPVTARFVRAGAAACWEATSSQALRAAADRLIAISD